MRVPVLLVTLALAGCLDPPEDVDAASVDAAVPLDPLTGAPVPAALDVNASVDAPVWAQGDAWSIETYGLGEEERATLVVTHADGNSYHVLSTSERMATFDAVFDVSYLGRLRADDLAGSQQETPVQFFDFPLSDGKSWTTRWDGQDVSLRAGFVPAIATPQGKHPGFVIQGTRTDGSTHVAYDYVPALRWWSRIEFAEGYGLKVTATTANWTGTVQDGAAKSLLKIGGEVPGGAGSMPGGQFTVDPDQTALVLTLGGYAERHLRALVLVDPQNQEHAGPYAGGSPAPAAEFSLTTYPPIAGQWKVASPTIHEAGAYSYEFLQVALAPVQV